MHVVYAEMSTYDLKRLANNVQCELSIRKDIGDAKTVQRLMASARAAGWEPAQGDVVDWVRARLFKEAK